MITYVPAGIAIPWDGIERGARTNNDGHGWAVASKHLGLEVGKSMDFTEAAVDLAAARERHGMSSVVLFHSRWGTHGVMGEFNVHPFYVDNDKQTVMAHNGVLPFEYHPEKKDPRSDTRIFVDRTARHFISEETGIPSRRRGQTLAKAIGSYNKLVFLSVASGTPRVRIINAWAGEWEGGVWYSNTGYRPFRSYYNTGSTTKWGGKAYWEYDYEDEWASYSGRRYTQEDWSPYTGTSGQGTIVGTGTVPDEGMESGDESADCPFCGAKDAVESLIGICKICDSCVDCCETAADCQCFSVSHHRKAAHLFDLPEIEAPKEVTSTNGRVIPLPTSAGWRSDVLD